LRNLHCVVRLCSALRFGSLNLGVPVPL
jgi:hypothetical protein